jgi:hypothetical protein
MTKSVKDQDWEDRVVVIIFVLFLIAGFYLIGGK